MVVLLLFSCLQGDILYLFFGSICLDGHLTDLSMAGTFFASTGFGGICCAGAYQQIVIKPKQKLFA
jgi:hypothetical protein